MPSSEWDLPNLKSTLQLSEREAPRRQKGTIFDVKFYPYSAPGVEPIFAVTGGCQTVIFKFVKSRMQVEVIRDFFDEDSNTSLNSCAWTKDATTGHPLICVSGALPKISILDIVSGELVTTLIGHGGPINDLAVSPASPQIIASGSEDGTVRLWTLDKAHKRQPCALICASQGEKTEILTIAFHPSGRYLLSGGMDTTVKMWTLPDLPNEDTGTDNPSLLHYPHFSTSAVHSDYVDCVAFYGDLVLSKCAREGKIVLWRIKGFSSNNAPLPASAAPIFHVDEPTRSAFGDGYERLLQFQTPDVDPYYIRFSLFFQPHKHAVLAMGNNSSTVFMWDIQQLVDWTPDAELPFTVVAARGSKKTGPAGKQAKNQAAAAAAAAAAAPPAVDLLSPGGNNAKPSRRHDISDPFAEIQAHSTIFVKRKGFVARQVAWSVGGEWMVVVGEMSTVAIFGRWEGDPVYVQLGSKGKT